MCEKLEFRTVSPLMKTFEELGDGWSFLILREAFFGRRKFEEFLQGTGMARERLSERLSFLLDRGVFEKRAYSERPLRHEYILSTKGHDIYAMTLMMKQWGDKWCATEPAPRLTLTHKSCGNPLYADIICKSCNRSPAFDELKLIELQSKQEPPVFHLRRRISKLFFDTTKRADSVARTLAVIGDQWTMAIVSVAFSGLTTFEQFKTRLGISRSTLTSRLNELVNNDVFQRRQYADKPARFEYILTPSGRDLYLVGLAMDDWGRRWLCDDESDYFIKHVTCDNPLNIDVVCSACREPIKDTDVSFSYSDMQP